MDTKSQLTVYFEDPFWVGVYERRSEGHLEAAKVTFGAEPKDYEVYDFFLKNWKRLRFSPPVAAAKAEDHKQNPKRMQRAVGSQLSKTGVGTKAQQALKLLQEQSAQERKAVRREKTEQEKQLQFELRRQKKKEKHNGH